MEGENRCIVLFDIGVHSFHATASIDCVIINQFQRNFVPEDEEGIHTADFQEWLSTFPSPVYIVTSDPSEMDQLKRVFPNLKLERVVLFPSYTFMLNENTFQEKMNSFIEELKTLRLQTPSSPPLLNPHSDAVFAKQVAIECLKQEILKLNQKE